MEWDENGRITGVYIGEGGGGGGGGGVGEKIWTTNGL